jgi:fumarate hydratase subunit beta
MLEQYDKTGKFPFDMRNAVIYYAGPAPAKPGQVIGPAGPTTSYRMDSFAPKLMDLGQTGMIGKGARNKEVIEAMKRNKAVYFAATGGAAALISSHIKKCEIIAYEDLGAEAIRKLYVEDFPAIVVIDTEGNNLYESEKEKYRTL